MEVSFHLYCLANTSSHRSYSSTTRLHKKIKNLELNITDLKYSGEDQILIFYFLKGILEEVDKVEMNEGKILVCIRNMLTRTPESK